MRNIILSLSLVLTLLFDSRTGYILALHDRRASANEDSPVKETLSVNGEPVIHLSTATNQTIRFQREDQEKIKKDIPHLVLNRNGVPTPGFERTLIVALDNLVAPPSSAYVQLTLETQHADPDLERRHNDRIRVWRESRFVPYDPRNQRPVTVQFRITFPPTLGLADKMIPMPTDYFRYRIILFDPQGNHLQSYSDEYAFLMENQWGAPLPHVLEASPGAAPSELLIYYCDMVPFQTDRHDPDTQIPRQGVGRYIQTELMPQMLKAFVAQTNGWELPWYKEWTNYRTEEDPKILSVALGGDQTWFHGSAPSLGHAMISIRVDGSFGEYSSLTEGIMSVFHHELFHNQQRNISLHFGSNGSIAGKDEVWKLFTEGTAVLAASVAQPDIQFEAAAQARSYVKRANSFIGSEGAVGGGLNAKYKNIPYHTALYWRFLYENCGGLTAAGEDPSTGMKIIRRALEALYQGEIVQIDASTDVAAAFPHIMDRALQDTPSCSFQSYEESLIHFARSIYMLRLEDGRCSSLVARPHCGLMDPNHLYQRPPAKILTMTTNTAAEIRDSIVSSYGIDFVEVDLDPSLRGRGLRLIFTTPDDPQVEFHVELWKTKTISEDGEPERRSAEGVEAISTQTQHGTLILEIEAVDGTTFDGLGLIITRMDPNEDSQGTGAYSVQLLSE